jgi:PTH2 family peptidyl-tRNA hydrolase
MSSKQVLVMKKFPSLRTGKYVAQGAHAAVGAVFALGKLDEYGDNLIIPLSNPFVKDWVIGSFAKIVLQADTNTDKELINLELAARAAGLPTSLITDSGRTEFNGVPTMTALGIGPGNIEDIDRITGHLKLL